MRYGLKTSDDIGWGEALVLIFIVIGFFLFIFFAFAVILAIIVACIKLFKKTEIPVVYAFIPIYNIYLLSKILCGKGFILITEIVTLLSCILISAYSSTQAVNTRGLHWDESLQKVVGGPSFQSIFGSYIGILILCAVIAYICNLYISYKIITGIHGEYKAVPAIVSVFLPYINLLGYLVYTALRTDKIKCYYIR